MLQTPWPAVFCRLDPFHTIFTLFLTGSLVVAGVTLLLSIFIRRFFCRYLCFLGGLCSNYSRGSVVELRADQDICKTCKAKAASRKAMASPAAVTTVTRATWLPAGKTARFAAQAACTGTPSPGPTTTRSSPPGWRCGRRGSARATQPQS